MRSTNEKTVTVKRGELLDKLRKNKEIHAKEFGELQDAYVTLCHEKVEQLARETSSGDFDLPRSYWDRPDKPSSHIEDYETAIAMFEMEVNNEIVITKTEFEQYVLDKWQWAGAFAMSKTAYGME